MARYQGKKQPVSEEQFEDMPERISEHFDCVRDRFEQELQDDSE